MVALLLSSKRRLATQACWGDPEPLVASWGGGQHLVSHCPSLRVWTAGFHSCIVLDPLFCGVRGTLRAGTTSVGSEFVPTFPEQLDCGKLSPEAVLDGNQASASPFRTRVLSADSLGNPTRLRALPVLKGKADFPSALPSAPEPWVSPEAAGPPSQSLNGGFAGNAAT